jgi:hypothetical protein
MAICDLIQTRAQLGKSSLVEYKGQEVDKLQLRRYMKTKARKDLTTVMVIRNGDIDKLSGHGLQCGNRM